ncbi:response regulator transcription factor [Telmatospirillum siberiense]|uniref:DNA-binding response regulator n=1 Tax=Telmatospirillum siberiense TaxID=382514 RepID=A0A2N3PNM9_9PROT|nr:response regulator transcription factor [Telmatospirillum siberiense]PKU22009.1 DNA-binding response regulator [Telmatospirillum siberiense]
MTPLPRLLLVDDDVELVEMMREYLEPEGFLINAAHDGASFWTAAPGDADLIILDVMLPGRSGFELLKELRKLSNVPVIMLTAKDDDVDRVVGLEIGADDYVSKPFNPRVLMARVRAVLRRASSDAKQSETADSTARLTAGDVALDHASREAFCAGRRLDLTTAEFNLLEIFLRNAGEVISRDDLSQAAFGRQNGVKVDRNVDTLVSKLRRKLDPDDDIECRIKTVRNAGYIYVPGNGKTP